MLPMRPLNRIQFGLMMFPSIVLVQSALAAASLITLAWISVYLFGRLKDIGLERRWIYFIVALGVISPAFVVPHFVHVRSGATIVPALCFPLQLILAI